MGGGRILYVWKKEEEKRREKEKERKWNSERRKQNLNDASSR